MKHPAEAEPSIHREAIPTNMDTGFFLAQTDGNPNEVRNTIDHGSAPLARLEALILHRHSISLFSAEYYYDLRFYLLAE